MVVERAQDMATLQIRTDADLLNWICQYVQQRGFTFTREVVADYYVSLKTKPFVILTGVSATGKTGLTQLVASALSGPDAGHYLLVPVSPDWTDDTYLLGYYNVIQERQIETAFSKFYRWSSDVRSEPFFVCLDEMNLAKVEHYFSHFLSKMETGELPPNLFITGTVNVDESTYLFSKKVLDRANTIEFNEVYLFDKPGGGSIQDNFTWAERQVIFDVFLKSRGPEWDEDVLFTLEVHTSRDALGRDGTVVQETWCVYPGPGVDGDMETSAPNSMQQPDGSRPGGGVGLVAVHPADESSWQRLEALLRRWFPDLSVSESEAVEGVPEHGGRRRPAPESR